MSCLSLAQGRVFVPEDVLAAPYQVLGCFQYPEAVCSEHLGCIAQSFQDCQPLS